MRVSQQSEINPGFEQSAPCFLCHPDPCWIHSRELPCALWTALNLAVEAVEHLLKTLVIGRRSGRNITVCKALEIDQKLVFQCAFLFKLESAPAGAGQVDLISDSCVYKSGFGFL